eukprot:m.799760 g.799760  ORF g.799760 m.799760 type:complete len:56 (-) comp59264_c0_seq88:141-308(-)
MKQTDRKNKAINAGKQREAFLSRLQLEEIPIDLAFRGGANLHEIQVPTRINNDPP